MARVYFATNRQPKVGAPGGYYQRGSLDGSRPGAYYINLKDTADWPKWGLPTLSYHEGSPGHHFQGSILQEAGSLPLYRRSGGGFSAYSEGWALYAEQVAADLGVYDAYEIGKVGYLQSYLFRATRLVVDTGLHHKRWTREQAIKFMMDNAAEPAGSAEREIDRYCVNPGQACSYKMGQTVIVALRAEAERKLGARFDIKALAAMKRRKASRSRYVPMSRANVSSSPLETSFVNSMRRRFCSSVGSSSGLKRAA